jgi:stage II sporulation protein AA (anti-sigma F factor antagonist)
MAGLASLHPLCNRVCVDQDGLDPAFSVAAETADDRVSLWVSGEVDMATADQMFDAALADGAGAAFIDLTGVTFFDSAAIHALVRLSDRFPQGFEVMPSPPVRRVLDIAGLGDQGWLRKNEG